MSRKYKEELNRIVMSEEMKKRILHNVLNENIELKSTMTGVKKYSVAKRNMQIIAACFTVVVCLSVVKSYPQLLNHENVNLQQKEISKDMDEENKVIPSDEDSKANDSKNYSKNEDIKSNDDKNESKNDNNSNNSGSNVQENKSISRYNSNSESSKMDESENNNENTNKSAKENSSQTVQQEANSASSVVNSNEAPSTDSKSLSDSNNENKESVSSEKALIDTAKNKDEIAKKKVGDDNNKESYSASMTMRARDPIKEYKTLEEAENSVEFKINPIKVLPKGYNIDNISVISNQIIQIEYNDGNDVISYRAGKEVDNISGDYNDYNFEDTVYINGVSVSLKGNNGNVVNLATWKKDNISYSLSYLNGGDKDTILNMVKSSF